MILADLHAAAEAVGCVSINAGAKGNATVGGARLYHAGGTQVLRFGTMRGLTLGWKRCCPTDRSMTGCRR